MSPAHFQLIHRVKSKQLVHDSQYAFSNHVKAMPCQNVFLY